MMKGFSWKTTLAGVGAIFGGLGQIAANDWVPTIEGITAITIGLGLIFGKDHDMKGGKRARPPLIR